MELSTISIKRGERENGIGGGSHGRQRGMEMLFHTFPIHVYGVDCQHQYVLSPAHNLCYGKIYINLDPPPIILSLYNVAGANGIETRVGRC